MPLPLPILDDIVIIKDLTFRCPVSEELKYILEKNILKGTHYIGTLLFNRSLYDTIPVVITTRQEKPTLFPERGVYLEGNPIPHLIEPEKVHVEEFEWYWVYKIYFL